MIFFAYFSRRLLTCPRSVRTWKVILQIATNTEKSVYTDAIDGISWFFREAGGNVTLPSPEDFCADFDITTIEEEYVNTELLGFSGTLLDILRHGSMKLFLGRL